MAVILFGIFIAFIVLGTAVVVGRDYFLPKKCEEAVIVEIRYMNPAMSTTAVSRGGMNLSNSQESYVLIYENKDGIKDSVLIPEEKAGEFHAGMKGTLVRKGKRFVEFH